MTQGVCPEWVRSDAFVPLRDGEIQVWRFDTAGEGPLANTCEALLSDAELERLGRMRAGMARDEFRMGRGCLRMLLGAALDVAARDVEIRVGTHGKPSVAGVEFNVAHSHGVVLIALCRDTAVGVDVEWIDRDIEALDIARGSFAPAEIVAIETAEDGPARVRAFYRCWARKEAVAKAHGQGLTLPLAEFAVATDEDGQEKCLLPGMAEAAASFHVRNLDMGTGFAAALAVGSGGFSVRLFELARELKPRRGWDGGQVTTDSVTLRAVAEHKCHGEHRAPLLV